MTFKTLIPKQNCPKCKAQLQFYDGALGYEAVVCRKCGFFADHNTTGQDDAYIVNHLKTHGESKNQPDSRYNKRQLKMGTKVEMEHTNSRLASKEIAKDHLEEIPDYYTRLAKMERNAKKKIQRKIYRGKRGGRFYIKNGRKVYV